MAESKAKMEDEREKPSRLVGIAERAKEGTKKVGRGIQKIINNTPLVLIVLAGGRIGDITSTCLMKDYFKCYGPQIEYYNDLASKLIEKLGLWQGSITTEMILLPLFLLGAYSLNKLGRKRGYPIKLGNILLSAISVGSFIQTYQNVKEFIKYPPCLF